MSDPTDTLRARVEQAQALAAAAPAGPWEWSVYAGRHPVRLCTESQFQAGSGYLLQLDADRIPAALASLIEAAPDLAALVTDLWAAYTMRAQDASVAVARACLERDAALAEVARLRGEAEGPPVVGGRELVWFGDSDFVGWHLGKPGDLSVDRALYSAWLTGLAEAYQSRGASHSRSVSSASLRVAASEAVNMARADGRTVPPHPEGWDVGVSDAG